MRSLDAQIWKLIFKSFKPEPSICCLKKLKPGVRNRDQERGRDAGIRTHNWIIRSPGMWLFFQRKRSGWRPSHLSEPGVASLMLCVSSPELTPTFVFTLSLPQSHPWLSLVHSYICLLLTVLLGRIYHHLLTYLSQNLSFDQLVFYNLHLFYI